MRWRVLSRLEDRLELPMAVLGLEWLALFVVDVVRGLDPFLTGLNTLVWLAFIADFVCASSSRPTGWPIYAAAGRPFSRS